MTTTRFTLRLFNLALLIAVLYATQIYPFGHFHHSHDGDDFDLVVSIHPVDVDTDHENHGHDCCSLEHPEADFDLLRPRLKSVGFTFSFNSHPVGTVEETSSSFPSFVKNLEPVKLNNEHYGHCFVPRGPPYLV